MSRRHSAMHVRSAQLYIDAACPRMGLLKCIHVDPQWAPGDASAAVSRARFGYDIQFGKGFFGPLYSPPERRDVIAHELGHVILWPHQEALHAAVGGRARRMLEAMEHDAINRIVLMARELLPEFRLGGRRHAWRSGRAAAGR